MMNNGTGKQDGQVMVTINGRRILVPASASVLEASAAAGLYLPAACGHPGLGELTCSLCAVAVEGEKGLHLACKIPVRDGMAIQTETPRIRSYRKRSLKKVAAAYQGPCLECPRVDMCDSTVCGRKDIPVDKRCSTCVPQEECRLRKAARYVLGIKVLHGRYTGS